MGIFHHVKSQIRDIHKPCNKFIFAHLVIWSLGFTHGNDYKFNFSSFFPYPYPKKHFLSLYLLTTAIFLNFKELH